MEDLGALKWIAIAAIVVYNVVRKNRKSARKGRQQSRSAAPGEAWPVRTARETTEKRIDMQPERVVPEHSARELLSEIVSAMQPQPDTTQRRKQPHTSYDTDLPTKQPKKEAKQPENAENCVESPDNEAFDLRQAVILSEILKPRFDE
ncbi:MAG: hypothetical protein K2I85_01080 [Alistipes sp.]|nr:hypothetical protein [Alistipes sp.]